MKNRSLLCLLSTLALVSCGGLSKKNNNTVTPEQQIVATAPEAQSAPNPTVTLPAAALVRVPVGADGKEDLAKAELRLQDQPAAMADAEIVTAFENAFAPASIAQEDELDQATSTQSWYFGRYKGGQYGNNNFYNCYQPSFYAQGTSYSYNSYPQTYGYGGYNYYAYNRPQTYANYGYSSYGSSSVGYPNQGGGYNNGGSANYPGGGYNNGGSANYPGGGYNNGGSANYPGGGYNNGGSANYPSSVY